MSTDDEPTGTDAASGGRARTRRRGLTPEKVVAGAIELADAEGIEAVSMARLAEHLGFSTMAIYRHVANKDELVARMVDHGIGPTRSATTPTAAAGDGEAVHATAAGDAEAVHATAAADAEAVHATAACAGEAVHATAAGDGEAVHATAAGDAEHVRATAAGDGEAVHATAAGGWRGGLERWALDFLDLLVAHPWVIYVDVVRLPMGPNRAAWLDRGLAALAGTQLSEPEKLAMILSLNSFVFGEGQLQLQVRAAEATGDDPGAALVALLAEPGFGERHPALRRALEQEQLGPPDPTEDDHFAWGLERLLDGFGVLVDRRARATAETRVAEIVARRPDPRSS